MLTLFLIFKDAIGHKQLRLDLTSFFSGTCLCIWSLLCLKSLSLMRARVSLLKLPLAALQDFTWAFS